MEPFKDQQRSHVAIWDWILRFGSCHIYSKRKRVSAFIIDETVIQIGNQHFWLWICIEPVHRNILGKHTVYTDGGTWYFKPVHFCI